MKQRLRVPRDVRGPDARMHYRRMVVAQDIRRVAREIGLPDGHAPAIADYEAHGRYGVQAITTAAGHRRRWRPAMKALGFISGKDRQAVSRQEVVRDIVRVAAELGDVRRMPPIREYMSRGNYALLTVWRKLGREKGWPGVAVEAGLKMEPSRKLKLYSESDFVVTYRKLAIRLGYRQGGPGPTGDDFKKYAGIYAGSVRKRFGTWSRFVEICGYEPRPYRTPPIRRKGDTKRAA